MKASLPSYRSIYPSPIMADELSKNETITVPTEVAQALEDLPEEKRNLVVGFIVRSSEFYSGPVMHPKHLAQMNDIIPDGALRIIAMTERQEEHRHRLESGQLHIYQWQSKWSLIGGMVLFALLIVSAVYCAIHDHEIVAAALLGVGACGVLAKIVSLPGKDKNP